MSEHEKRKSPPRLAPRPSVLQHVPQKTIKKTKTRISNACTACKARKTKCDNNKPKCTACTVRPDSVCVYFPSLDKRKRQNVPSDKDVRNREHELLTKIFNATKYCSKEELPQLLEVIRGDATIEEIAEYVQEQLGSNVGPGDPDLSMSAAAQGHEESEREQAEGESSTSSLIFHRKSSDAMYIGNLVQISVPFVPSQPWTSITQNDEFVSHLVQLFFTWEAPIYDIIEKDVFVADMRSGDVENASYCSPLLVNIVLATASMHSDREESFVNDYDHRTAGLHFFAEAERLWQSSEKSTSLTNMQALITMHYFQAQQGSDAAGMQYFKLGLDMYREISSNDFKSHDSQGDPLRLNWPCWKLWARKSFAALILRYPYELPPPDIPRPQIPEKADPNDSWQPYPQLARSYPQRKIELAHHCIDLAILVHEISWYLYSKDGPTVTPSGIISLHGKLQQWYEGYLASMTSSEGNIGPDLILRILFHAVEIHLLRGSLTHAAPVNTENSQMISTALQAACESARLQKIYYQLYGARGILPLTYNAYQSALVTLYFLDIKECCDAFIENAKGLFRLGKKRVMSAFILWTVGSVAKLEGIKLPDEVTGMLETVESMRHMFEQRNTRIPVPALNSKAPGLIRFKEGLLSESGDPSGAESSTSRPTTAEGKGKGPPTSVFNPIDPILGDLSQFYKRMLTLMTREPEQL
ncbi:hypothetical protein TWF696_004839 [Orbilia brochopaga]|uniref:Zn(2)-C6 fungal-type domain-containing protein n=1 Tax=Orbilia brochopaga TaxID=3140254 RepID=A0AAV9V0I2_9PEZI